MTHTDKLTVVTKALLSIIQAEAAKGSNTSLRAVTTDDDGVNVPMVNIDDIFYGDQDKLPRVPAVCLEPGNVVRDLDGVATRGMVRNNFSVAIFVYHVNMEVQQTRMQVDEIGEAIQTLLHANLQLKVGGTDPQDETVIHGFVTGFQSGYTFRQPKGLYRSVMMTWEGTTKTRLS